MIILAPSKKQGYYDDIESFDIFMSPNMSLCVCATTLIGVCVCVSA